MPITRSAKKKLRQDKKRQRYNLLVKKSVKSALKSFKKNPSVDLLPKVFSLLDKSAKKNIFHPNKVARLKSNLSKLITEKTNTAKTTNKPLKAKKRKETADKSS